MFDIKPPEVAGADLQVARRRVKDLVFQTEATPNGYCMLQGAVWAAEHAEKIGDASDTRRLAEVLSLALQNAAERGDQKAIENHGADLLAVQSDLADQAREDAAERVNALVAALPAHIVQLGKARFVARREKANV